MIVITFEQRQASHFMELAFPKTPLTQDAFFLEFHFDQRSYGPAVGQICGGLNSIELQLIKSIGQYGCQRFGHQPASSIGRRQLMSITQARGLSNMYSSCALTSGHSPARKLYITVSRIVPSRRKAWPRITPSLRAPRRSMAV